MNDLSTSTSSSTEEPLDFADFNAKLLVLDVLCYDLDVLDPYVRDSYEDAVAEDEDVEGQDSAAREYYDDIEILPAHVALVTELSVDPALDIYQDVHPGWDGSDDRYDPQNWDDLLDLPALERVFVTAPLPAHVEQAFRERNISVETQ
jgi:hypothetical protein